jgi:hypothetical protein
MLASRHQRIARCVSEAKVDVQRVSGAVTEKS